MPLPVSLRAFVDELDTFSDEHHVYLNRRTGEFLLTDGELRTAAEEEDGEEGAGMLAGWQREELPKVREALSSDDWLALPSKFEIDEYTLMRDFCHSLEDKVLAGDLLDTIGGRGTFGRWKNLLHRHNVLDAWYRFRDKAQREIAVEWLERHRIPYCE